MSQTRVSYTALQRCFLRIGLGYSVILGRGFNDQRLLAQKAHTLFLRRDKFWFLSHVSGPKKLFLGGATTTGAKFWEVDRARISDYLEISEFSCILQVGAKNEYCYNL